GIIPEHIKAQEVQHHGLTELHVVPDMHTRKRMMVERADAFVVLPGGMGTLDETFEILTWKKLKLHNKPVVIYNSPGYWDDLLTLTNKMTGQALENRSTTAYFRVATGVDEMFEALESDSTPAISPVPAGCSAFQALGDLPVVFQFFQRTKGRQDGTAREQ